MIHDADFTTAQYRGLLELAKQRYAFAGFNEPWPEGPLVLWRHDCDFSLPRAARIAAIEQAHGVRSTFFLNPHCEFYNLLEKSQTHLVREIVACGHDLGVHFDAAYYALTHEDDLDRLVAQEALWIRDWTGVTPVAVSFHNPTEFLLGCDRETYGGLVNCYSRRLRDEFGYCSDSNGYWRHRRLHDVLLDGVDQRLQVLTHPDWWQEQAMPPRARVFRAAYGRASAQLRDYDSFIHRHGRLNLFGRSAALAAIASVDADRYRLCDYLWNEGHFETLVAELVRLAGRMGRALPEELAAITTPVVLGRPAPPSTDLESVCEALCQQLSDTYVPRS